MFISSKFCVFESNLQKNTPQHAEMNVLLNGYLGFLLCFEFVIFNFSKKNVDRIKFLTYGKKAKHSVMKLLSFTADKLSKFQYDILIFDCRMTENLGKADIVTVLNIFFNCRL